MASVKTAPEVVETRESPDLQLISEHGFPRKKATVVAALLGVLMGVVNIFLDVDFTMRWSLVGWLALVVVTMVFLHEGVHGLAAIVFGHRPIFGIKPPLVYMTLRTKIPRGHLIVIALAPLIVLDALFLGLYCLDLDQMKLFSSLCFTVNTIGAVGDLWIFFKLLPHERGVLVQDTKTGFEVWASPAGDRESS